MSQSSPIARHCMPQKQTHQIAMTALRSVAPASGGFGPDRIGRAPSFAMASSSAIRMAYKWQRPAPRSHCQPCVDLRHDRGTLSHGGGHAFGRARPHVADGEHSGFTGLKRHGRVDRCRSVAGASRPGHHETLVIQPDAALKPRGVRIGTDEQEQMAEKTGPLSATAAVSEYGRSETPGPVTL